MIVLLRMRFCLAKKIFSISARALRRPRWPRTHRWMAMEATVCLLHLRMHQMSITGIGCRLVFACLDNTLVQQKRMTALAKTPGSCHAHRGLGSTPGSCAVHQSFITAGSNSGPHGQTRKSFSMNFFHRTDFLSRAALEN
jgi:hypothetical protein